MQASRRRCLSRRQRIDAAVCRAACTPATGAASRCCIAETGLPAATINGVVQSLIPPPKYHVDQARSPERRCAPRPQLAGMVIIQRGGVGDVTLTRGDEALDDPAGELRGRLRLPAVSAHRPAPLHAARRRPPGRGAICDLECPRRLVRDADAVVVDGLVAARARAHGHRGRDRGSGSRAVAVHQHPRRDADLGRERRAGRVEVRVRQTAYRSAASLAGDPGSVSPREAGFAGGSRLRYGLRVAAGVSPFVLVVTAVAAALAAGAALLLGASVLLPAILVGAVAAGASAAFVVSPADTDAPKRLTVTWRPAQRPAKRTLRPWLTAGILANHRRRARHPLLALQRRRLQQRRGRLRGPGRGHRARPAARAVLPGLPRAPAALPDASLSIGYHLHLGDWFGRAAAIGFGAPLRARHLRARAPAVRRARRPDRGALLALMPYHVIVSRQVLLDGPQRSSRRSRCAC